MCGICGKISNKKVTYEDVCAINQAMHHRGPDDSGIYLNKTHNRHVGLGHRRLSIIDLSDDARQPISNENNSIALVANGEIYNYKEVTDRLIKLGHRFKTRTDSEVIIHAYEQWGTGCLEELKGMFAFAVWDSNKELLFLARDLFGEKPLFYTHNNDTLIFASELPAILKDADISPKLDAQALIEYLYYQVNFAPQTMVKGINKLPPGHFAMFYDSRLEIHDYAGKIIKPCNIAGPKSYDACSEEMEDIFDSVIEPLMISDVPIGLFLSGGIDSSYILSLMAGKTDQQIHTFSIGFDNEEFNELKWAGKMAQYFGTRHHDDIVDLDIVNVLPELISHLGEPMADASIIPYYHLSRLAASYVKVVLGGDGADEIWGGYRRHLLRPYLKLLSLAGPAVKKISPLFKASDGYYASSLIEKFKLAIQLYEAQKKGYAPWNPLFDFREINLLVNPDFLETTDCLSVDFTKYSNRIDVCNDRINEMLWIDQSTFLPEDILTKVDRMSMAHSLEVRAPFLHPDIASFAATVPGDYKISGFQTKKILKTIAAKFIPHEIINRKKHGFNVPVDAWFRKKGKGLLMDILLPGRLISEGLLQKKYISKIINEHIKRVSNHGRRLWSLLVLEMWMEQFV